MTTDTRECLLTTFEVGRITKNSVRTLESWRLKGGGPPFVRISRRSVRYRRSDLEQWIEDRVVTSTSEEPRASKR